MSGGLARWVVAVSVAIIVHLAAYWSLALRPSDSRPAMGEPERSASFHFGEAESFPLFDPRPILLPTEWNAANAERLKELVDEERPIFPALPPAFQSGEGSFIAQFGNRPPEERSVRELAFSFPSDSFKGIGMAREPPKSSGEALHIRAVDPRDGTEVYEMSLEVPEAATLAERWPDWQPASFIFHVADTFILNRGGVVSSSGYPEADQLLIGLIRRGLAPVDGLPNGPFLVEIGP